MDILETLSASVVRDASKEKIADFFDIIRDDFNFNRAEAISLEVRAALLSRNKEVCRALKIPFLPYADLQGRYKDRLKVYAFLVVDGLNLLS